VNRRRAGGQEAELRPQKWGGSLTITAMRGKITWSMAGCRKLSPMREPLHRASVLG
jgi:hypothetical protein